MITSASSCVDLKSGRRMRVPRRSCSGSSCCEVIMSLFGAEGRLSIKSDFAISISCIFVLITRKVTSFAGSGLVLLKV